MVKIIKVCKHHGNLTLEETYQELNSKMKSGFQIRCRYCKREKDTKWRECNREQHNLTASQARNESRRLYREGLTDVEPKANTWVKNDRKLNPEKYRRYEQNYIKKHGIEKIRKYEVARIHGLTINEYELLIEKYNNLCAVCGLPERRIGRDGKTITPLCVDHCHQCEEKGKHVIRGLLCHACNSSMGKLKDNIQTLKNIISYLEKHKCN